MSKEGLVLFFFLLKSSENENIWEFIQQNLIYCRIYSPTLEKLISNFCSNVMSQMKSWHGRSFLISLVNKCYRLTKIREKSVYHKGMWSTSNEPRLFTICLPFFHHLFVSLAWLPLSQNPLTVSEILTECFLTGLVVGRSWEKPIYSNLLLVQLLWGYKNSQIAFFITLRILLYLF